MKNLHTDHGDVPEEPNLRNYGLDLLRVLAMLFIVLHHLLNSNIWGDVTQSVYVKAFSVNLTSALLDCFFIVGVNVFFLLSGWLKINLRISKVIILLAECWAIGIISVALAALTDSTQYTGFGQAALQALAFPFSHWFIPAYLLLCLLSPLLNSLVDKLTRRGAVYAAAVLFVLFCLIGFAADYFYVIGMQGEDITSKVSYTGTNAGYSVIWACVCYLTGRLMHLHTPEKLKSVKLSFALYTACCLVNFAVLCVAIAVLKDGEIAKWYIYCYNNPFTFLGSACLLCAFAHIKVTQRTGKFFAFLSAHAFAVYIMHSDNPLLSPHRAYILELSDGMLWAQVLLLPINAVVLFAIGVAVSVLYCITIGKAVKKLGMLADRRIQNKISVHKE